MSEPRLSQSIRYQSASQQTALRYIMWYWDEVGTGPSIREIQAALGVKSTSTALAVVERLEEQGFITRDPRHRRITLVEGTGIHQHDWRVEEEIRMGTWYELRVQCLTCHRKTAVEHTWDQDDPSTWLRYVGEVG